MTTALLVLALSAALLRLGWLLAPLRHERGAAETVDGFNRALAALAPSGPPRRARRRAPARPAPRRRSPARAARSRPARPAPARRPSRPRVPPTS